MKAHLMYADRDFCIDQESAASESDLAQDLELSVLFRAMAAGDNFLAQVAEQAVLSGPRNDVDTILYRQDVLRDCLRNKAAVRDIYEIAVEAVAGPRSRRMLITGRHPGSILYDAVRLLEWLTDMLGMLKRQADAHAHAFRSAGFTTFFTMIQIELGDEYLSRVRRTLKALKFRNGVLISAELGEGNVGTNYVLRAWPERSSNWFRRLLRRQPPGYTYRLANRDDAGARALSEMRNRGINVVANAAAQSADHILSFFAMLRTELGFYVGCLNLHRRLAAKGVPVCFPVPAPPGTGRHSAVGLRDVCLVLTTQAAVIGNDLQADGKKLVIITGANQGGKTVFLRSIGLAQSMMQCGMFVVAESFRADLCRAVFTHYRRGEDPSMANGKFDEELARLSSIVDLLTPDSLLLFNESCAATNEREGSETADQIVRALLEAGAKVFFVTHLHTFAYGLWEEKRETVLFLRAEREADGRRTFRLPPGEPLETSFGEDLYKKVFGVESKAPQCDPAAQG